jgi:hypothetical protein
MGCKKKFVEKLYYKVVVDLTVPFKIINSGNANGLVTKPESGSYILTTKETGSKFLKEKPNTVVTEIVYITPENAALLGSPNIWNYEIRIDEKNSNSFLSYQGTEIFPIPPPILPGSNLTATVSAASGRFKGAEKVESVIVNTVEGNFLTKTTTATITGYR